MLRIGLLGASWIAPLAIVAPAARRPERDVQVVGIAARDPARAARFAAEHGLPRAYPTYGALIESPEVDLVYISLPPTLHRGVSVAASAAGKSVLCEKPFAACPEDAQAMVEAGRAAGRAVLEAFHYRFHPLMQRVIALVRSGALGPIRYVRASVQTAVPKLEGSFRLDAALGGGALLDVGAYAVHWLRTLFGEPEVLEARAAWHPAGVEHRVEARLRLPGGIPADLVCDLTAARRDTSLRIEGAAGRLEADGLVVPHRGNRLRWSGEEGSWEQEVSGPATFDHQLEHVLGVLSGREAPLTGGKDAIGNLRTLRAIAGLVHVQRAADRGGEPS